MARGTSNSWSNAQARFSLRVFRTCTCGQACACGQNTIFPISRVFQACACGTCTSKAPILKSVSAKVMDVESRLPGCAGQAADAVSAHTQVKMDDAPTLLKIPKSECPDIGIRLPKHKWPKSWSSMEDPVVPLERNLCGHPVAGSCGNGNLRKFYLKYGWEPCLFGLHSKAMPD